MYMLIYLGVVVTSQCIYVYMYTYIHACMCVSVYMCVTCFKQIQFLFVKCPAIKSDKGTKRKAV